MNYESFLSVAFIALFLAHDISGMEKKAVIDHIKQDEDASLRRLIEEKRLDPRCTFQSNRTMLHEAVSHNAKKVVELLLKCKVDVNQADDHGVCPLHVLALYEDRHSIADLLLAFESLTIDPKDEYGLTPLHLAVMVTNYYMIHWLKTNGADPLKCDNEGKNAYDKALGASRILALLHANK